MATPPSGTLPNWSASWMPLQRCSAETRRALEQASRPEQLAAGTIFLRAGEPATRVVLTREGKLRVFHQHGDDREFTIKILRAPDAVGALESVRGGVWAASVEALTPVEALIIPADALQAALATDLAFSRAVLEDLAAKFVGTISAFRALGFDDAETRVLRVIAEYAEQFGRPVGEAVEVRFALSRNRLVRESGLARRSVDRALASLKDDGLVELSEKGWLMVLRPAAVRERLERGSGD